MEHPYYRTYQHKPYKPSQSHLFNTCLLGQCSVFALSDRLDKEVERWGAVRRLHSVCDQRKYRGCIPPRLFHWYIPEFRWTNPDFRGARLAPGQGTAHGWEGTSRSSLNASQQVERHSVSEVEARASQLSQTPAAEVRSSCNLCRRHWSRLLTATMLCKQDVSNRFWTHVPQPEEERGQIDWIKDLKKV
jgi:hypothetical protein